MLVIVYSADLFFVHPIFNSGGVGVKNRENVLNGWSLTELWGELSAISVCYIFVCMYEHDFGYGVLLLGIQNVFCLELIGLN